MLVFRSRFTTCISIFTAGFLYNVVRLIVLVVRLAMAVALVRGEEEGFGRYVDEEGCRSNAQSGECAFEAVPSREGSGVSPRLTGADRISIGSCYAEQQWRGSLSPPWIIRRTAGCCGELPGVKAGQVASRRHGVLASKIS